MNKTLAFFRFVFQNEWYINCIPGSVDELPHALVPLPENLPRVFDEERNPLFSLWLRKRSSRLTFFSMHCIINTSKGGVSMTNFAQSVAPYILYTCSLVLLPLGVNRFRAGSPVKGFLDFVGAGVIAVMAWSLANP